MQNIKIVLIGTKDTAGWVELNAFYEIYCHVKHTIPFSSHYHHKCCRPALSLKLRIKNFLLASSLPLRESSSDLTESQVTQNVKFYLYTKSYPSTPQQLFINNEVSINSSYFENSRQTRILIHGWGGSYTSSPNRELRDAYFSKDDYNIISVDWFEYAKLNYVSARNKVPKVGEAVAEFTDYLNENFNMSYQTLVVIGHSLGAHVAGYCGKSVKRGQIAAIVGLDPAMPLYRYDKPATRLANTDAEYVQTIQTNGGVKGFLQPIGSASFYPNWGRLQPGCGIDRDGSCSHGRCVALYAEAVRGYSYAPIYKCNGFENISQKAGCNGIEPIIQMGDPLHIDRISGIYYLNTNDKVPYGHLTERAET